MDYAFDNYFENNPEDNNANPNPNSIVNANAVNNNVEYELRTDFVYDERRIFSKLYVFLKSIGLAFYTLTLTTCDKPTVFLIMNTVTFLSILNSARYEYKHYRRYGTTFSSIGEFEIWKHQLLPKTRIIFAGTELGLKIWYIINIFPPQFDFESSCNLGKSILNMHIAGLFMIYVVVGVFSLYLSCTACCYDVNHYHPHTYNVRPREPVSSPLPVLNDVVLNINQECCICMDTDNIQPWVGLPCGHMFHTSCVSRWITTHHTCPVCRFDMRIIV